MGAKRAPLTKEELDAKRKKNDEKRRLALLEAEEEGSDEDRLADKDEVINERTFYQKNREMLYKSVEESKLTSEERVWWKEAKHIDEQAIAWKKSAKIEKQALDVAAKTDS